MSLATAVPAPPPHGCGNNDHSGISLSRLTAESMLESQQPAQTGSDEAILPAAAAWLQQQRSQSKLQDSGCPAEVVMGARSREREEDAAYGGSLQQQQQPAEDARLHRLLASEGLMRCETLNLFRAQLQQLSRRKDGLMPRADGSFPENWLLLAWDYQALAEEVMNCQRWPGKYPEGLLRCVTHQVLYLKRRLEAFPTMSGAKRDQFRRLYVLAALGIIAKLKLVTFCWTFVELKRGEEIADQVTEAGRCQQSWQPQVSGSNVEAPVNLRATQSGSTFCVAGHDPISGGELVLDTISSAESLPARGKKRALSQQVPHEVQASADSGRALRKKDDRQRLRDEHQQHPEMRSQEQDRNAVTSGVQHIQEVQHDTRHRSEGGQFDPQEKKLPEEEVEREPESSMKEGTYLPLSPAAGLSVEGGWERPGKSEERTVAASEEEAGGAQEVNSTCSLPSRRIDDMKNQPPGHLSGGKADGAEVSKKAEANQRDQAEGPDLEAHEEEKAEAPERTEYTTRSGRRTHRVKADAS